MTNAIKRLLFPGGRWRDAHTGGTSLDEKQAEVERLVEETYAVVQAVQQERKALGLTRVNPVGDFIRRGFEEDRRDGR